MGRPDVEMPHMDLPGRLRYGRSPAIVAGDEVIDDQMRTVIDLGALDVLRAYDHGITSYNDRRAAYGLECAVSFTEMTG